MRAGAVGMKITINEIGYVLPHRPSLDSLGPYYHELGRYCVLFKRFTNNSWVKGNLLVLVPHHPQKFSFPVLIKLQNFGVVSICGVAHQRRNGVGMQKFTDLVYPDLGSFDSPKKQLEQQFHKARKET